MNPSIFYTGILTLAFLALFASAEAIYHIWNVSAEISRKYVHIGTGLLSMLFPPLIKDPWLVMFLCASFLLILVLSLKFNLLKSINGIDRCSRGSILYPIIVCICFFVADYYGQMLYFYLPILLMAICDPLAALSGQKWPVGVYRILGEKRTFLGSSVFFISAFILSLGLMYFLSNCPLQAQMIYAIALALVSTFAEAFTLKGYDNLAIPLSALFVIVSLENFIS